MMVGMEELEDVSEKIEAARFGATALLLKKITNISLCILQHVKK